MIRIAIIDDNVTDQEKLISYFELFSQEKDLHCTTLCFADGASFLLAHQKERFDLVMMDIELGEKENGIDISKELRQFDEEATLVFMTNLAQYAIEGYRVSATDYIVKPISYDDFKARMSSILPRIKEKNAEKIIIVSDGKKVILPQRQIYYVEVNNHNLIYHTAKGNFRCRCTMKKVLSELDTHLFSLCNNCYLVNLEYVESIQGMNCVVHGDTLLISHPRRKSFLSDLSNYLGE